jgi:hypothetical protein
MPSIINASSTGSGGIVQTADASGVLQLQSNGTVAVNIDASANVGIGTTSPSVKLTVVGNIRAGYEAATGINIGLPTSVPTNDVNSYIFWGTDTYFGGINGDLVYVPRTSAAGTHRFYTGNGGAATEKVRITNAGVLDLATGAGAVGQIQFPATQVASADANTLDDYEEGSWTPAFIIGSGSVTYTVQAGRYVKIGKSVTLTFWIQLNSVSSPSGSGLAFNLPFVIESGQQRPTAAIRGYQFSGVSGTVGAWSAGGQSSAEVVNYINGTATALNANTLAGGTEIGGSYSYTTN